MPEVRAYLDHRGRNLFSLWMDGLSPTVRHRIQQILGRMTEGNLGDVRAVGEGVIERRADFGPGYRIYFAWDGPDLIILLGGGDKSAQRDDIPSARERWRDYRMRKARGGNDAAV